MTANKAKIRERANRELPGDEETRKLLEAIADGKRKMIDADWWRKIHGDIVDRAKLDKIAAMADPLRNDKENERRVAETSIHARLQARRPPGMPPRPPPLPKSAAEWIKRRKIKTPPRPSPLASRILSDSVATPVPAQDARKRSADTVSDSVAGAATSDSVAHLNDHNKQRAAKRAKNRAGLKCRSCGKPLAAAQRATARYCNATCRSQAWRAQAG